MTAARLVNLWETWGPRYGDGDLFALKRIEMARTNTRATFDYAYELLAVKRKLAHPVYRDAVGSRGREYPP